MNAPLNHGLPELAAVMVTLLDDRQAAAILSKLTAAELETLGERMCALGEIGPEAILRSIASFSERTARLGLPAEPREGRVRALISEAIGDIKADGLMQRIAPDAEGSALTSLEILKWLTPSALVRLVHGEHPQAAALLLVQLDPEVAAQVLHGLPQDAQPDIVHRIATMGPVSPEALVMLEDLVTRKLKDPQAGEAIAMGGAMNAANIINNSGKALEKRVMPDIQKRDKALAKSIEDELFKFEHLFTLDPQSMGALLREVDNEVLIDALKGIGETERDVFFRAMSSRAADGLRDEIASRGRLKLADVVAAQKQIVGVAKRLAADGTLAMGGEDGDYV